MSSPFEQLVIDSLDRIERKGDALVLALGDHAENDRVQFLAMESSLDTLTTDFALRKRAAEDAGHAAGASAGKFWGIIGTVLAALISGVTAAAR